MDQQIEIQIKCLSPKKTLVLLRCFWKKWRIANNSIIRTVVWRKRLAIAEVTSDTRTRFELHQSRYHYNFQNTNFSDNILKKKKKLWLQHMNHMSWVWEMAIHQDNPEFDQKKSIWTKNKLTRPNCHPIIRSWSTIHNPLFIFLW